MEDTSNPPAVFQRVGAEEILPLRAAVLRPGRPRDVARYAEDGRSDVIHAAAWYRPQTSPQVCLTLMPSAWEGEPAWQLRGMASAPEVRGTGLALQLLQRAMSWAEEHNPDTRALWCNARLVAVGFYERAGWAVVSDVFDIPEIGPHHRMLWRRGFNAGAPG